MTDIKNRQDIKQLVEAFYEKATKDPLIGHYFTNALVSNWAGHIETIVSFWDNILFQTGTYKGGMLFKHLNVQQETAFRREHFAQWLSLWEETVHQLFEGPFADEAIFRAKSIAGIMEVKLRTH